VIERLREWSQVPVLVLSVRQAEAEKVAALDAGANDYIVKPFGVAELLARVRALLRNSQAQDAQAEALITVGDLMIDLARHEVRQDGAPVPLTPKEFRLLSLLARHAGRLLIHRQLLRDIWGPAHETDTQYLRVFIGQLRSKLDDDPADPKHILNEPGVAYRLLDRA
jgi:two-component system KDP operon response regulator KdpE